jgi:hypothetical protein
MEAAPKEAVVKSICRRVFEIMSVSVFILIKPHLEALKAIFFKRHHVLV